LEYPDQQRQPRQCCQLAKSSAAEQKICSKNLGKKEAKFFGIAFRSSFALTFSHESNANVTHLSITDKLFDYYGRKILKRVGNPA
jgi:hypothetical protein